jgi:ClpP class serine protease
MNEIGTETDFLKFRVTTLLIFFLVLFIALASRAFQLQVLSSEILKEGYNRQHANALETRQLVKDLQQSLDKLSAEQKKQITDAIILGTEKAKLLKEIDELKPQYDKLSDDVQLLQKTLRDMSILQDKEAENIVRIYDQIYRKEKWSSFITSFIMGIVASVIASIIYNSVSKRSKMPPMGSFIKIIKDRLIHIKKEE